MTFVAIFTLGAVDSRSFSVGAAADRNIRRMVVDAGNVFVLDLFEARARV